MSNSAGMCLCLSFQKQARHSIERACSEMISTGFQSVTAHNLNLASHVRGGATNLCLRCGKPGATRLCHSGCNIAKFCSEGCERAAMQSHSGACRTAAEVKQRQQGAAEPTDAQLGTLQALLLLVGKHMNPLFSLDGNADMVPRFLCQHPEIIQRQLADYLFLSCEGLQHDRVCCNPHIYTWCLLDGCLQTGDVMEFAASIGLSTEVPDSPLGAEQARQRFMDWQRNAVLPLQEMFGQVGMGKFWEKNPAPPADGRQRRSLDMARPLRSSAAVAERGRSSSFPPQGRRSVDFRGTPAVIAVRCDLADPTMPGCHAESLWTSSRPPLSRRNSTAADSLA